MTRTCSTCRETKPLDDFARSKKTHDGRANKCRVCNKAYLKQCRQERPNEFKEWYAANKARRAVYWREWYDKNKETRAIQYAEWAKANSGTVNALIAKRTAAKKRAIPRWANLAAIKAMYAAAARLTRETGIRYEVDHIYPLQSDRVCGLHCEANLQIITKADNLRKGNKMPDECVA